MRFLASVTLSVTFSVIFACVMQECVVITNYEVASATFAVSSTRYNMAKVYEVQHG